MAINPKIEPKNGVLTNSMDTTSKAFKELQLFLANKAAALNKEQKLQIEAFALQIKIEDS